MAYTQKSREAAADVLREVTKFLEESPANWAAVMIMSLAMEFGFDDIRIDACTQREKTFRKKIVGFTAAAWVEKRITENAPFLNDLYQACDGDINTFDESVNWVSMAKAWKTAAGWLERSSNQVQDGDSEKENQ